MKKVFKFVLSIIITSFIGCNKIDENFNPQNTTIDSLTPELAKQWFLKNVVNNSSNRQSTNDKNLLAHWKVSEKKKDLKGNSFVSIPVFETSSDKITEEHLDKNSFKLYMFREVPFAVTNLVIYTDEKGKIQYELIKYIPDRKVRMQDNVKFTGHTIVTDWNGKFIKGYKIKNGQVIDNIYEQKSQKNGKVLACEYIDTSWTEIGANSEGGYIIVHQSGYFSGCGGQDPNSLASSGLYGFFPSIPSNTGSSSNGSGTSSITLTDDQIVDAVQAELPEGGCLQERLYYYANLGDGIAQRDMID